MNSAGVGVPKLLLLVETEIGVVSTGSQLAGMPAVEVLVPMEDVPEAESVAVAEPREAEFDSVQESKSSLLVQDVVEKQVLVPTVDVVGTGLALVAKDSWVAGLVLWAVVAVESAEPTKAVLELDSVVESMHLQMAVFALAAWPERPKEVGAVTPSEVESKKAVAVAVWVMPNVALTVIVGTVVVGSRLDVPELDFDLVAKH
ncbi:hypothetical protein ROHU_036156 [Labeo rohita]|uniref:Uncharacterized protein n=1 Tax=Labeo rohita TaxID=84645 RepID=A0A498NJI1_LABRO|nr:hypothetical protein ROHU_036156 [Labeo rohita]